MKIKDYFEAERIYKSGSEVWACAYEYTSSKEGREFFQKPIKGKLMVGKTEENNRFYEQKGRDIICYFVPYKKNSNELAWSKAVSCYARCYADSKEECIELYNELINDNIRWHEKELEKLKNSLIEYEEELEI